MIGIPLCRLLLDIRTIQIPWCASKLDDTSVANIDIGFYSIFPDRP